MRKKVLFDYAERYTERGDYYYQRIAAALKPIFAEAENDNIKIRELSHAIGLTADMLEVEVILSRSITKVTDRWGQDAGIVPPSAPRMHGKH
jgi:hypothetical protein